MCGPPSCRRCRRGGRRSIRSISNSNLPSLQPTQLLGVLPLWDFRFRDGNGSIDTLQNISVYAFITIRLLKKLKKLNLCEEGVFVANDKEGSKSAPASVEVDVVCWWPCALRQAVTSPHRSTSGGEPVEQSCRHSSTARSNIRVEELYVVRCL